MPHLNGHAMYALEGIMYHGYSNNAIVVAVHVPVTVVGVFLVVAIVVVIQRRTERKTHQSHRPG